MECRISSENYCFDLFEGCVHVLWSCRKYSDVRLMFEMDNMEWFFNFSMSIDKCDNVKSEHIICIGIAYDKTISMAVLGLLRRRIEGILRDIISDISIDWMIEESGAIGTARVRVVPCDLPTVMARVSQVIERLR